MKLTYYRSRELNFGDDLNADLWPAVAPGLFGADPGNAFVGMGTIIGMPCEAGPRLHVFTSGVGNDPVENWQGRDVTYWCVRGPISARVLGLAADRAITDGAILTPMVPGFPDKATPGKSVLIMPHHHTLDFPGWADVAARTGFELLDVRASPQSVIARIASAGLVLTESLHGAVLADTYGIPWNVFGTSRNFGSTKFVDWCGSLGMGLHLTHVPPPNAEQILRLGRGSGEWGKTEAFTVEGALAAFKARTAPAPAKQDLRARVKAQVERSAILRRLLGYTPARTAAALTALSRATPQLSDEATRARLRAQLLDRLRELERFNQGLSPAS